MRRKKMKTFVIAITAAILLAAQSFTLAAAAPSPATVLASEKCGSTYKVQHLDNLSKIAELCDTSVANILAGNPQVTNPNVIYTGQVLSLTGSVSENVDSDITYKVKSGDTLQEIADLFDVTVSAIRQANATLRNNGTIYTGMVLNIPESTVTGSTGSTGTSGSARVNLSATRAEPGDEVTVSVTGFPANSWIDYRVGEEDEDYTDVYDGTVSKNGTDSQVITIPFDADDGEYWVVRVMTTSQKNGVDVTSSRIYIDD
jgi:LysM repeat protein